MLKKKRPAFTTSIEKGSKFLNLKDAEIKKIMDKQRQKNRLVKSKFMGAHNKFEQERATGLADKFLQKNSKISKNDKWMKNLNKNADFNRQVS